MTSFVEVLNVELSDPESHFDELIKFFFMFHDPTTKDMQANDAERIRRNHYMRFKDWPVSEPSLN